MSTKKILAALLAASLTATALASCGGDTKESSTGGETSTGGSEATSTASVSTPEASGTLTYPVEGSPSITYWVDLNSNVSAGSASMNDTPLIKAMIEATGVQVEYLHPAQGAATEAFNLLIHSGDLPDIVEYAWLSSYPGGPELAFKNQLLEPLNENMAAWAPDYTAYLNENPDIAKMVRTDEGNYFGFPFIRGAGDLMVFYGPYVRKDMLEKVGLDAPTTIADWYEMLTAFKNELGCTAPLTTIDKDLRLFNFGFLTGAYNVTTGFNLNDEGKIVYGPIEPGFKDFLTEMNKWYSEGLIDPNFYTNDRNAGQANLLNDISGASIGYAGSGIGVFQVALEQINPDASFMGVVYPSLEEGKMSRFGQRDFAFMTNYQVAGVSAKSENKEAAYAYLNYGWTEEGEMLYNFGIEGESYDMVDGYPTYKESITNPGEGKTMAQMLGQYTRSVYNGPFVQRIEYYEQYMQMDIQKDAVTEWKKTEAEKYQVPPVTPTQDESKEYNTIKTNMDTWLAEWAIGAITGANSIDDFESVFVEEMKNIGVDRALEIQNAALERYNNR